jgi:hypothetical protein
LYATKIKISVPVPSTNCCEEVDLSYPYDCYVTYVGKKWIPSEECLGTYPATYLNCVKFENFLRTKHIV